MKQDLSDLAKFQVKNAIKLWLSYSSVAKGKR